MSNFNVLEKDLIKRTKANLEFIQKAKEKDADVYEATQLFNSLLGIIVNIREDEKKNGIIAVNFESIKLDDREKEKWAIPKEIKDENLMKFLINLRNAVAHIDITFESVDKAEIQNIVFGDSIGNDWKCCFSIKDLWTFIEKLCDCVE